MLAAELAGFVVFIVNLANDAPISGGDGTPVDDKIRPAIHLSGSEIQIS